MILELGGKTFNLTGSPKLKVLVALEEKGIKMIDRHLDEKFTVAETMHLITHTLLSFDSEVTEDWVQEHVNVGNMKEVADAVGTFFGQEVPST